MAAEPNWSLQFTVLVKICVCQYKVKYWVATCNTPQLQVWHDGNHVHVTAVIHDHHMHISKAHNVSVLSVFCFPTFPCSFLLSSSSSSSFFYSLLLFLHYHPLYLLLRLLLLLFSYTSFSSFHYLPPNYKYLLPLPPLHFLFLFRFLTHLPLLIVCIPSSTKCYRTNFYIYRTVEMTASNRRQYT